MSVLAIGTYAAAMLKRPPRDRVITTAMALFAGGLISLAAMVVLFMTGHRNLPTWLSISSLLMPIGFAIGAVHTVRQWHRDQPTAAEGTAEDPETADPETANRQPAGQGTADRRTADRRSADPDTADGGTADRRAGDATAADQTATAQDVQD